MQNLRHNYQNKKEILLYKSLTEVRVFPSESFKHSYMKATLKLKTLRQICYFLIIKSLITFFKSNAITSCSRANGSS